MRMLVGINQNLKIEPKRWHIAFFMSFCVKKLIFEGENIMNLEELPGIETTHLDNKVLREKER